MKRLLVIALLVIPGLFAILLTAGTASAATGDAPIPWSAELEQTTIADQHLVDGWGVSLGAAPMKWEHASSYPGESPCCGEGSAQDTHYEFATNTARISQASLITWSRESWLGSNQVLAHEFTHHLQWLATPDTKDSVDIERQANCGSGVFIRWLQQNGLLTITIGDVIDLEKAIMNGVNDTIHGSALDMAIAFRLGYDAGTLSACVQVYHSPLAGA